MQGHNFIVIGKAGTGKSFVAKHIMSSLMSSGKKFQLVCSTGIACEVYKGEEWPLSNAIVMNSFFGIGIPDRPFDIIVQEAL